jgi:phage replication O-like protein O
MAKAQLENGFTKIANELLEKIASSKLSQNEFKVLFAIIRLSYGWRQKNTDTRATGKALSEFTGLRSDQVFKMLKSLTKKAVINASRQQGCNVYAINTDLAKWESIIDTNRVYTKRVDTKHVENQTRIMSNNRHESCQTIDTNHVYSSGLCCTSDAALQTPKEIKEIKERKKEEQAPPDLSKISNAVKALGLPATAILSPRDHDVLNALLESGCNFSDIEQARIKRKKNRLEWIQDTVCEMRDARLATVAQIDHNGIPILPNGRMDWDNMTFDQKSLAMQMRYEL